MRWSDVVLRENNNLTSSPLVLISDASLEVRGRAVKDKQRGSLGSKEQKDDINILELKVANLTILTYTLMHP